MGKTLIKICKFCGKEIKEPRRKHAKMHKKCADEVKLLKTLIIIDKKRLPQRKSKLRKKSDKLGVTEEIIQEVKPKLKNEIINDLKDGRLLENPNSFSWYLRLNSITEDIPLRQKQIDYADIIDLIKKNKKNSKPSTSS